MARRLTARGERRRRQLMEVAAERFAVAGYHPTSIADIVDAVGVGKGVFYWYFASKEELFEQILVEAQRDLRRTQRAAIADEPDPLRRIEAGVRASVAWLDEHRHLFTLFELARADERFAPVIRRGEEQAVADTLPHVVAGMDADLIRREDPVVVAYAILGVVDRLTRVLVLEEDRPAEAVADAAVAFCLQGLVSPAAARARLAFR
ncbi:TetR/AcrR family transcriptional regulator [Aciditerrimonas ferrireducens]|uniref:TetR/AcrR family transcriptional regulator n=1 Tax=Aciditerrimonas ferrireducens TaxID=667306 RepID=A0ABV6C6D4_9ACTN